MPKKKGQEVSEYLKVSHRDFCDIAEHSNAEQLVDIINDLYTNENHNDFAEECIQRLDVAIVELEKRTIAEYLSDTGHTIASKAEEVANSLSFDLDVNDRAQKRYNKLIKSFNAKESKEKPISNKRKNDQTE
eukprot:gb/GECG01004230.1/.p1 GENE.gb/GECG01004230.1/~~gb/GECG01004230.1/.p1  ORF type:complete len:132 (+),score=28.24 gb/GECG01004230.1/:1-396(+)